MSEKKAMVIGYGFCDGCVQIGYYSSNMDEPELLHQSAEEASPIPVTLCRLESGQWLYGTEAVSAGRQGLGPVVEDLVRLCAEGEPVVVEDVPYMPGELLAVFVKKSLNLIHRIANLDQISGMTFSFEHLTERVITDMQQIISQMPIPAERMYIQDFKESFYDFVTYQKRELWTNDVMLLDARGGRLKVWELGRAKASHGVPFMVGETVFEQFKFGRKDQATDEQFAKLLAQLIQKRLISSVFLMGKEFEGDWMKESLRYLCRGRRVFGVEHMAVKGACYRCLRPAETKDDKRQYYLGEQQIKFHVGLYVWNGREQQYCRLIWAGTNWFEGASSNIFLLDQCDSVCIQTDFVTEAPEDKRSVRQTIPLNWIPKRPNLATKVRVDIRFQGVDDWTVTVTDLGLGDLFPASGKSVTRQMGG